jgi:hypothetical protein
MMIISFEKLKILKTENDTGTQLKVSRVVRNQNAPTDIYLEEMEGDRLVV